LVFFSKLDRLLVFCPGYACFFVRRLRSEKNQHNITERDLSFDEAVELDWDNAWIYEDGSMTTEGCVTPITACLGSRYILFLLVRLKKGFE